MSIDRYNITISLSRLATIPSIELSLLPLVIFTLSITLTLFYLDPKRVLPYLKAIEASSFNSDNVTTFLRDYIAIVRRYATSDSYIALVLANYYIEGIREEVSDLYDKYKNL